MAKRTPVGGLDADTPLSEAARRLIAARLADVRLHEEDVRLPSPGKKQVHALRVATRRLSSALRLLGDKDLRELRGSVEALKDALGPVRDAQVRTGKLGALATRHFRRDLKALHRALEAWQREGAREVADRTAVLERRGRLGGKKVRKRLARALERLDGRAALALDGLGPRAIHRARIASKKLRYALELVDEAVPGAKQAIKLLEPLQEKLGQLHDVDALLALRVLPSGLRGRLEAQRGRKASAVKSALESWASGKSLEKLREAL